VELPDEQQKGQENQEKEESSKHEDVG